jgi:hypothetical protein
MLSRHFFIFFEPIAKPAYFVTPAKTGVQNALKRLDSGFRRNDAEGLLQLALLLRVFLLRFFTEGKVGIVPAKHMLNAVI